MIERIKIKIIEMKSMTGISQISNMKKIMGKDKYYRLRIGDYRVGLNLRMMKLH